MRSPKVEALTKSPFGNVANLETGLEEPNCLLKLPSIELLILIFCKSPPEPLTISPFGKIVNALTQLSCVQRPSFLLTVPLIGFHMLIVESAEPLTISPFGNIAKALTE
jgi:hypothetical protein